MTSTMGQDQIVEMDGTGRVKTPRERREALLAEFDHSGMNGQAFVKWAGIKYGTFITWVQKRRRKGAPGPANLVPTGTKTEVQWVRLKDWQLHKHQEEPIHRPADLWPLEQLTALRTVKPYRLARTDHAQGGSRNDGGLWNPSANYVFGCN